LRREVESARREVSTLLRSIKEAPNAVGDPVADIVKEVREHEKFRGTRVRFRPVDWKKEAVVCVSDWAADADLGGLEPEFARRVFWRTDPGEIDCVVGWVAKLARIAEMELKGEDVPAEMRAGLPDGPIVLESCYSFDFDKNREDKAKLEPFKEHIRKRKAEVEKKQAKLEDYHGYLSNLTKDGTFGSKGFDPSAPGPWLLKKESEQSRKMQQWQEVWKITADEEAAAFVGAVKHAAEAYKELGVSIGIYLTHIERTLKSEIVLPVTVGGSFYGIMNFHSQQVFTAEQQDLASCYAGLLAITYFHKRKIVQDRFREVQGLAGRSDLASIATALAAGVRSALLGIPETQVAPLLYACLHPISPQDNLDDFARRFAYQPRRWLSDWEENLGRIPVRENGIGRTAVEAWKDASKQSESPKACKYLQVCEDVDDLDSDTGSKTARLQKVESTACLPLVFNRQVYGLLYIHCKSRHYFTDFDLDALELLAAQAAQAISQTEQSDFEYLAIRGKAKTVKMVPSGDVLIRHGLTSICPSDLAYFEHRKDRKSLDDHLPMALGHETTGIVQQIRGEHQYENTDVPIRAGDRVVVIPLIPCRTCEVCTSVYGENYCPSSRFMASNAPGSLRTKYRYDPELLLKIPDDLKENHAVFTELMSNAVQALTELGCGTNRFDFAPVFKNHRTISYFNLARESFASVFNTLAAEERFPRTTYFLDTQGLSSNQIPKDYEISLYNLQRKGLMVVGGTADSLRVQVGADVHGGQKIPIENPRILIIGSGPLAYVLTLALTQKFEMRRERLFIIGGEQQAKLHRFRNYAREARLRAELPGDPIKAGERVVDIAGGKFDVVFECVGQMALAENIQIAMSCLKNRGVLGIFGLSSDKVRIDLGQLISKHLFLRGFYRGSLQSFRESLKYIAEVPAIREGLEGLIGKKVHEVKDEMGLQEVFLTVLKDRPFERQIVRLIQ
jgi:threonine dehydrogenase-like Zn-dependent dehydrogenase/putative methionine-R-sulfoxide reductase with GAF domain